jgi:site-specific recombinase XerC
LTRTEAARRSAELESLFDGVRMPEHTRRLYATQWRQFVAWCSDEGWLALPARPRVVVLYFVSLIREGLSAGTIKTVSSVISKAHELSDHPSPTDDPIVRRWRRRLLEGMSDEQRVIPLTPDQMRQIVSLMYTGLVDLRDRALLLVAYALRLRRAALVSLNLEDVLVVPSGLELIVRGKRMLLPRGQHEQTCPVRALQTWIRVAALNPGPLFLQITRWGRPGGRLSGTSVSAILRSRAAAAGLTIKGISADSLHVGPPDDRLLL